MMRFFSSTAEVVMVDEMVEEAVEAAVLLCLASDAKSCSVKESVIWKHSCSNMSRSSSILLAFFTSSSSTGGTTMGGDDGAVVLDAQTSKAPALGVDGCCLCMASSCSSFISS